MKAKLTSMTYLTLGLLATLLIGSILPSLAQNRPNCSSPMTQADMNFCAGQSFRVADAELNRVYNQFINNFPLLHFFRSHFSILSNLIAVFQPIMMKIKCCKA